MCFLHIQEYELSSELTIDTALCLLPMTCMVALYHFSLKSMEMHSQISKRDKPYDVWLETCWILLQSAIQQEGKDLCDENQPKLSNSMLQVSTVVLFKACQQLWFVFKSKWKICYTHFYLWIRTTTVVSFIQVAQLCCFRFKLFVKFHHGRQNLGLCLWPVFRLLNGNHSSLVEKDHNQGDIGCIFYLNEIFQAEIFTQTHYSEFWIL